MDEDAPSLEDPRDAALWAWTERRRVEAEESATALRELANELGVTADIPHLPHIGYLDLGLEGKIDRWPFALSTLSEDVYTVRVLDAGNVLPPLVAAGVWPEQDPSLAQALRVAVAAVRTAARRAYCEHHIRLGRTTRYCPDCGAPFRDPAEK